MTTSALPPREHTRVATKRTGQRPGGPSGPQGPDGRRLAGIVALAWLEALSGQRPRRQLDGVLSPALQRRLASQVTSDRRCGGPVRLRRVISSCPRPGALEAAVLVEQDGRTSALAVRLERHLGAWRAVELTAPEAGLRPLATASLQHRSAPDAFDEVLLESLQDPSEPLPSELEPPGGDATKASPKDGHARPHDAGGRPEGRVTLRDSA